MRKIALVFMISTIQFLSTPTCASELAYSGKADFLANPFIAFGYNPKTKITTGYLAAIRTAPGRTDECKLVFANDSNNKNEFFVRYAEDEEVVGKLDRFQSRVRLVVEQKYAFFKFSREKLGGDCDWILPFVVESSVPEDQSQVTVAIEADIRGDWIAVSLISAKKAKFYSRPESSSVQKAFLVKGDVIYVYQEMPGWYYVKYDGERKKTGGWIRKSDTLQP